MEYDGFGGRESIGASCGAKRLVQGALLHAFSNIHKILPMLLNIRRILRMFLDDGIKISPFDISIYAGTS